MQKSGCKAGAGPPDTSGLWLNPAKGFYMHIGLFVAAALLAAPVAFAQDVSPGLWEITMETRVPADSGFQPPPYKMQQCITAQEAKDPGQLFSVMGNPGASNCRYQDRNYHAGNTFTFAMTCQGTYQLRSSG